MSYTYSKAIDLQTNSQTTSNAIPNVFDISSERGPSDYDARHVFNMGWSLTLPRVRNGSSFMKVLAEQLGLWRQVHYALGESV